MCFLCHNCDHSHVSAAASISTGANMHLHSNLPTYAAHVPPLPHVYLPVLPRQRLHSCTCASPFPHVLQSEPYYYKWTPASSGDTRSGELVGIRNRLYGSDKWPPGADERVSGRASAACFMGLPGTSTELHVDRSTAENVAIAILGAKYKPQSVPAGYFPPDVAPDTLAVWTMGSPKTYHAVRTRLQDRESRFLTYEDYKVGQETPFRPTCSHITPRTALCHHTLLMMPACVCHDAQSPLLFMASLTLPHLLASPLARLPACWPRRLVTLSRSTIPCLERSCTSTRSTVTWLPCPQAGGTRSSILRHA